MRFAVLPALFLAVMPSSHGEPGRGPGEPNNDAARTCGFLSDLVNAQASTIEEDRGDVLGVSRLYRPVSGDEPDLVDEIANRPMLHADRFLARIGLSAGAYLDLIARALMPSSESELEVDCPDLLGQWPDADEATTVWSRRFESRQARSALPEDHPDYLPPVEWMACGPAGDAVPRLNVILVSRPVFDEAGHFAIAEVRSGLAQYMREDGRWVPIGVLRPTYC